MVASTAACSPSVMAFHGSMGVRLNQPVMGLVPDHDNVGYWLVARLRRLRLRCVVRGSMGSTRLNKPVIGMVGWCRLPDGRRGRWHLQPRTSRSRFVARTRRRCRSCRWLRTRAGPKMASALVTARRPFFDTVGRDDAAAAARNVLPQWSGNESRCGDTRHHARSTAAAGSLRTRVVVLS
jgi:hypothetical protein